MKDVIFVLDVVGTFVFAVSGLLTARKLKFDIMGTVTLGFITAIGGGTIRDLLLGIQPVGWLSDPIYIYTICTAVPLVYFFKEGLQKFRKGFFLFDTIGIGLYTIIGLEKTINMGLGYSQALLLGVVSAVFGGILRDVISNMEPLIFRHEIYATACLTGGLTYIGLNELELPYELNLGLSISVVCFIRIYSVVKKLSLEDVYAAIFKRK